MVTPTGLEPVTSRLGISRSILMSYGAIYPLFIAGFSLLSKSHKVVWEVVLKWRLREDSNPQPAD